MTLNVNSSSGQDPRPSKSFGFSLPFGLSKNSEAQKNKMSLSNIKLRMELCFQELETPEADHLRHKLRGTREVKDLWMLRSDVHQLISREISQIEAAERINALLPCFAHWLPANEVVKI